MIQAFKSLKNLSWNICNLHASRILRSSVASKSSQAAMTVERLPDPFPNVDISTLGDSIVFRTSKRKANNRFLKAAMSERLATWASPDEPRRNGIPRRNLVNLYQKWGVGGWGVVVTGNMLVDMKHLEAPGNAIICRENDTPELRNALTELAREGKKDGALLLAQINHAGRQTPFLINPTPYGASDIQLTKAAMPGKWGKPIAMSKELIKSEAVERFAYATKVLYECGFDGVQLHGALGYLISQFLSPTTNTRNDEYGGDVKQRSRIVKEIYDAIRRDVPVASGFIVAIKMNSVEFQERGLQTNDAAVIAAELEKIGFDFIELTGGTYEDITPFSDKRESTIKRESYFLEFAGQIRSSVKSIPIYVTGGFRTSSAMAKAVQEGTCQGIGLGRLAANEFDFPKKVLNEGVRSATANKLLHNFQGSSGAAIAQIYGASKTSLADVNGDPNGGVPDFTKLETVEAFQKAAGEFYAASQAAAAKGELRVAHIDISATSVKA